MPIWMKSPPLSLAREKAVKWKAYKEIRREFGRNHELAVAALDAFNGVNYRYRNFVRNNQYFYESSLVERLVSAPNLFHSYMRKRKKACPSVGPLKTEHGRIMS